MVAVLFDTCILIDYLRGIPQARAECNRHADRAISVISWMEVMAGATTGNEAETRAFLLNFFLLPLTQEVAERAVSIRRSKRSRRKTFFKDRGRWKSLRGRMPRFSGSTQ